jgi:hypothetical protein
MLPVAPVELAEFLLSASQADLQAFDLAEPAFALGLSDAGDEVVADLLQPAGGANISHKLNRNDLELECKPSTTLGVTHGYGRIFAARASRACRLDGGGAPCGQRHERAFLLAVPRP